MPSEDVRRRRAERDARADVVPLVSHDRRAASRESAGPEGAHVEKSARFSTAASAPEGRNGSFGVMRAHEDAGEGNAPGGIAPHDLGVHGVHLAPGQEPPREAGLVRHDEEGGPRTREDAEPLGGARRETDVLRVAEKTALDDECSVPVEKERVEGRTARCLAGPAQGLAASVLRTASENDRSVCGPRSRAAISPLRS